MGLFAHARHLPRHEDVPTVAEHPAEGVARKGSWERLLPGHDHPTVQPPREGHCDPLLRFEIPREVPRKDVPDLPVVWFPLQENLVFPLPWLEVRSLPLEGAVPEDPGRAAGEHVNALEK